MISNKTLGKLALIIAFQVALAAQCLEVKAEAKLDPFLKEYQAADAIFEGKPLSQEKRKLGSVLDLRTTYYFQTYEVVKVWKGAKYTVGQKVSGYGYGPGHTGPIDLVIVYPFRFPSDDSVEKDAIQFQVHGIEIRDGETGQFFDWLKYISHAKNVKDQSLRSRRFLLKKRNAMQKKCNTLQKSDKPGCLNGLNAWPID